jgi:hypothetical protein
VSVISSGRVAEPWAYRPGPTDVVNAPVERVWALLADPRRYVLRHVRESATAWETYVLAEQRWDRNVAGVSLGATAALVGLSALARQKVPRAGGHPLPRRPTS